MGNIEHPTSNSEHRKWEKGLLCIPHNHASLRFLLVKPGKNTLAIVGLNPSTADCLKPDPTMKSINRLMAGFQGNETQFDGFLMVNLYPLRLTKPNELPRTADPDLEKENLRHIQEAFKKHRVKTIWAAWGNNIVTRPYLLNGLASLAKLSARMGLGWKKCDERTKSGHPRHPLYLKTGKALSNFDLESYLGSLK